MCSNLGGLRPASWNFEKVSKEQFPFDVAQWKEGNGQLNIPFLYGIHTNSRFGISRISITQFSLLGCRRLGDCMSLFFGGIVVASQRKSPLTNEDFKSDGIG